MANTYSAGIVTAYGAAVRGGYTGTYEEFCAQQAAFAENAEQVAEDRAAVEQIKTTFENQTVPAAVGQVNQAGAAQVQAVQAAGAAEASDIAAAGTAQEARVLQAGTDQEAAVNTAGSAQVQAVQAAGAAQVTAVQGAGTTQVAAVNAAGAAQVDAVEDKGEEVLASIPQDYSALSGEVDDLKSATTTSTNAMQTTLLECLKNAMWDGVDGATLLQAYCTSIGLAGWIDVKPKTAIDGTTGNLYVAGTNRQASDYIDVSGFASMTAVLNNDSAPYEMWYAVRCYDADKAFLGAADPAGTVYASTSRAFLTGTAFVRLMFTPNVNTHPNDNLAGIYTGHTIDFTLVDASANSTVRRYYLSEVDDFASA